MSDLIDAVQENIVDLIEGGYYNVPDFNKTIKEMSELFSSTIKMLKQNYNTINCLAKRLKYKIKTNKLGQYKLNYKNSEIDINIVDQAKNIFTINDYEGFICEDTDCDVTISNIENTMIYNIILYDILEKIPKQFRYIRAKIPMCKLLNVYIDDEKNVVVNSDKTDKQVFKSSFANPNLEKDLTQFIITYKEPKPKKLKVPKNWTEKLFDNIKSEWQGKQYNNSTPDDLSRDVKNKLRTMIGEYNKV